MKGQKWPTFTPPATALCRRYRGRVLLRRSQVFCSAEVFYDPDPDMFPKQFPTLVKANLGYADLLIQHRGGILREFEKNPDVRALGEKLIYEFMVNLCRCKHHSFFEEREYRIIAFPVFFEGETIASDKKEKPILTRGQGEIRYISIGGGAFHIKNVIERVIIGPSRNQNALRQRVEKLLPDTEIRLSEIPLIR
jgi:hypothetical protein